MNESKNYLLVDASNHIHRFAAAMPPLSGPDGIQTHALVGFINLFCNPHRQMPFLPQDYQTICFWDIPGKRSTNNPTPLWLKYKGNRPKKDPSICTQIGLCYRASVMLGWGNAGEPGVEADALIGAFCLNTLSRDSEAKIWVATSDKDALQLVGSQVSCVSSATKPYSEIKAEQVRSRWGVNPCQIADFLVLAGDKSDNIPGIPGIGEKSARECLRTYKNLEEAMFHITRAVQLGEKIPRYAKLLIEHSDRIPILMNLIKFSEIPVPIRQEPAKISDLKELLMALNCVQTVSKVQAYQARLRGDSGDVFKRLKSKVRAPETTAEECSG